MKLTPAQSAASEYFGNLKGLRALLRLSAGDKSNDEIRRAAAANGIPMRPIVSNQLALVGSTD